ncbi:thiamine pyrophosphokinase 2 isoform X1 [Scleropages formosus]|uniref:thiamine pyrophosphokinase 2 isoform X1 n=1 Tax=Scleropages formosus TaxID=113540 RepID=UPI0010FA7EB4|nr:nudix hydrolase 20, chloroplastic-like isoform X1 [Scleropages formosus]
MATSLLPWSDKALALLCRMNNFHLPGSSLVRCRRFVIEGQQVGWVPPVVASKLTRFPEVFTSSGSGEAGAVALCPALDSYRKRSEAVNTVLQQLREEDTFSCLRGWRDEVTLIGAMVGTHDGTEKVCARARARAPHRSLLKRRSFVRLFACLFVLQKYEVMPRFCDQSLMCMERAATSLFGVKRYGVHVNGYRQEEDGTVTMWLSRRSRTKQTYPGTLDNLVAGGLAAGTSLQETLIKECEEEACIPACIAETACPVGTVSYTYEDEDGVFPESQFVFDLKLPLEFRPQIGDGEVQDFYLWPLDQVKEVLVSEDFKPNSAMVVLDFLIRHSYVHPDAEPYYQEFVTGLHKSL